MKILDLGCGNKKYEGKPGDKVIGIDENPRTQADVLHDLNKQPYPFKNNEFDLVIADFVIEHLNDPIKVIEELHRITKPNGLIRINVLHFSSARNYADITHKHHGFAYDSFRNCFDVDGKFNFYTTKHFKVKQKIIFGRVFRGLGLEWFANKFPNIYENFLAFAFQSRDMCVKMKVVK